MLRHTPQPLPFSLLLLAVFAIFFGACGLLFSGYSVWRAAESRALWSDTMSREQQRQLLTDLSSIAQDPALIDEAALPQTLSRLSPNFAAEWRELTANPQIAAQVRGALGSVQRYLAGNRRERILAFFENGQAQEVLTQALSAGRILGLGALLELALSVGFLLGGWAFIARRNWGRGVLSASLLLAPVLSALALWLAAEPIIRATYTLLVLSEIAITAPVENWLSFAALLIWGSGGLFLLLHALLVWPILSEKTNRYFDCEENG